MLDIKFIKENADLIKAGARKKHLDFDLDELIKTDERRLKLLAAVEKIRAEQNAANDEVAKADSGARTTLIERLKIVKAGLQAKETELTEVMKIWQKLMLAVPNVPDISVPEGGSDADNQETRTWGIPTKFSFTPKSHIDLMLNLDLVDFDRGTKVAGFRGYFLKNEGALLSFAVWQLALDQLVRKGFVPMLTPSLVRREPFIGTGYLPQAEDELYKTQDELYLAGTAEVPTMGYYMDEVIDRAQLPLKFVSFSPCFRREAGSHGKDTKGLIRLHEFFKLEQVILDEANHEKSVEHHETLTRNAEEILQLLKLPYRVVTNCGGDLGLGQVKKYDLEVWVPTEKKYRETHSSSYFHDFQTRRLNIRYRDAEGKLRFAHSLNNTGVATPRILAAIVENYQQADGSVLVPVALQAYLGKKIISRNGASKD
jgi:seryl-tRNA synthetase